MATIEEVKKRFPKIFQGLGNRGKEYNIKLQSDAKPYALFAPRHVPLPLHQGGTGLDGEGRSYLKSLRTNCMVCWDGSCSQEISNLCICVDLKPLNQSVLRKVHPLPRVDETLAQLSGAKIFSKLDANSGLWQIRLSQSSRLLTTFITPSGRYCFNKLPLGICSAPELFQRRMSELLTGVQGTQCLMDDILVYGKNQVEHNQRLKAVLSHIEHAGVTLNIQKCEFSKRRIIFLGHVIGPEGITADPE